MEYDHIAVPTADGCHFDLPPGGFLRVAGREPGPADASPDCPGYFRLPADLRGGMQSEVTRGGELRVGLWRDGRVAAFRLVPAAPPVPRKKVRRLGGSGDIDPALLPAEFRDRHWAGWEGLWELAEFFEVDGELYIGYEDPEEDLLHHWSQDGHCTGQAEPRTEFGLVRRNGEYLFAAHYTPSFATAVRSPDDGRVFAVHTG